MKSLYDFIIEPLGDKYSNTIKIGDKDVVVNTKIENWKFVNRLATVVQIPKAFKTKIKEGDIIVVHQNIFRRFYDMQGRQKNGRSYFKNNKYFVSLDQIYLYKNKDKWRAINDRCFIKPIKNTDKLSIKKEQPCVGILKIGNNTLEALNINPEDKIGFKPGFEWEFIIDNERLYCMKSNDIVIKYEHKGNEEEYNPSWTSSGKRVN